MDCEVLYKCYYLPLVHEFPRIEIRYRCDGHKGWTKIQDDYLDKYADSQLWFGRFSIRVGRSNLDTDTRLNEFMDQLTERCDGDLDKYVEKIVKKDIRAYLASKSREEKKRDFLARLITGGWKGINIKVDI